MMSVKKIRMIACFALCVTAQSYAMNILYPYDTLIRMPLTDKHTWQLAFYAEGGVSHAKSFGPSGTVCDPLNIWQCEQNALTMLQGFGPDTQMSALRNQLNAPDDGVRGRFITSADLNIQYELAFCARAHVLKHFSLGAYLPVMSMSLDEVCWRDQTKDVTDSDVRTRELLTDPNVFFAKVAQLGNLDLGGWKRTGCGDLVIMLEWFRDFPQPKPLLKNVFINWRLGVNIPTGLRADEDKLFAIPFGYDGATGLIFGLGLELMMGSYFKCGVDVQLTQLFDVIRERRIKTDPHQTELLLLEKARVHRDFGLVQRFNLDIEGLYHGFSCKLGYQYFKRGDTKLSLVCNDFSDAVANTAESLQQITMHQFIVNTSYNFESLVKRKSPVIPYVSLYARIPFNGQRTVQQTMLGTVVGINF